MTEKKDIFHQNFESDFCLPFQFENGLPNYPWRLEFRTKGTPVKGDYIVSFDGKKYTRCEPMEGRSDCVMVEFNDHMLGCGRLTYKLREAAPDGFFSDGKRDTTLPVTLDVELYDGPTDGTIPPKEIIQGENAARTFLINLSLTNYPLVALQAIREMEDGKPVIASIRTTEGGPLQTMTDIWDAGEAYIIAGTDMQGMQADGIAKLERVRYLVSKATGNIRQVRETLLQSLLTTAAVQDDLDGDAPALPISQRQVKKLKRLIDELDGQTLKKDDILIFNGNGAGIHNNNQ